MATSNRAQIYTSLTDVTFLHAGAYWLMWSLRRLAPKRSVWRFAQFDTIRLNLIKLAARIVEMKTMIKIHLPSAAPCQDILRVILERQQRLVTCMTGQSAPKPNPAQSTHKHPELKHRPRSG